MAKKSKLLGHLGEFMQDIKIENVEELNIEVLKELTVTMKDITDYRGDISYHSLENIIMIVFLALMGNCNEWVEIYQFGVIHQDWFKKFLDLPYGIPSISTIRKTMAVIDPEELEEMCVKYIIKKIEELQNILNIEDSKEKDILSYDGKVCRGSKRDNTKEGKVNPVNAMSAFNVSKDICLATKYIEDKTNEIPTGPELIKLLDLTNTISTFDALNTQEKTISTIVDKNGDYVAAVKGNQEILFKDIKDYFEDKLLYKEALEEACVIEMEKSHNRMEKRTYIMTSKIEWLVGKDKWKNIKSIGISKLEYQENGKSIEEIRYYITSLESTEINDFKNAVRGEWGIENNLHWHLDYTFKEDANLTMNKNAQANLNVLRKLCLNILKLIKPLYNMSLKLIRFRLGQNFEEEINYILKYLNTNELKTIIENTQ